MEDFSKLVGVTGLFQVIGLAVGSVLLGRIYDAAASHDRGVQTMLVISVIALVITALIGMPARKEVSIPPAAP